MTTFTGTAKSKRFSFGTPLPVSQKIEDYRVEWERGTPFYISVLSLEELMMNYQVSLNLRADLSGFSQRVLLNNSLILFTLTVTDDTGRISQRFYDSRNLRIVNGRFSDNGESSLGEIVFLPKSFTFASNPDAGDSTSSLNYLQIICDITVTVESVVSGFFLAILAVFIVIVAVIVFIIRLRWGIIIQPRYGYRY
jgi:hypothetical protein